MRIAIDPATVTALGISAEMIIVIEAHEKLLAATEAAQKKLDAHPFLPHIARSLSFEHGLTVPAVIRVRASGLWAFGTGPGEESDPPTDDEDVPAPAPKARDGMTAGEIRALARTAGLDFTNKRLSSDKSKKEALEEIESFKVGQLTLELDQAPAEIPPEPETVVPEPVTITASVPEPASPSGKPKPLPLMARPSLFDLPDE